MIGQELGSYRIVESLGKGTMGEVFRAEDPQGRLVALKLVQSSTLYDVNRRERFLRDMLAVSGLSHPSLCPVLEIGDENDDFFLVTPLFEGKTLADALRRGPIEWRRALDLVIEIGEAVEIGHRAGIMHRNLKPANIILLCEGGLRLMDFGVARFTEFTRGGRIAPPGRGFDFAQTVIPMNALASMSPEQVRGAPVDRRSDVFSLGAMLYEMMTGKHPFTAPNTLSRMRAIMDASPPPPGSHGIPIPQGLDPILERCLAKDPADRYQTMKDFLQELRWIRDHAEEPAALQTAGGPLDRPEAASRRKVWTGLAALAAALLFLWLLLGRA